MLESVIAKLNDLPLTNLLTLKKMYRLIENHIITDSTNDNIERRPTKTMSIVNVRNVDLETPLHLAAYTGMNIGLNQSIAFSAK